MDSELVTVKTFENIAKASLVQSFLLSEGVESFLQDEHIGQLFGFGSLLGIRLQVKAEDVHKAIELLIEGGFASAGEYK